MNLQKLTQKSLEAIQAAQNLAIERSHVNVDCQHLLEALLIQENGLIPALLQRMGVDTASLRKAVEVSLDKIPGVTGPGREEGKIYVSSQLDRALTASERTARSRIYSATIPSKKIISYRPSPPPGAIPG